MFQNTAAAMAQVLEAMNNAPNFKEMDLSVEEGRALHRMMRMCADYMDAYDDLVNSQ
jgi:hypothetical protein